MLKNLNFKKGVLGLVVRNELQVKSVRLSASLKLEKWALECATYEKGRGESKSASLSSTLPSHKRTHRHQAIRTKNRKSATFNFEIMNNNGSAREM